MKRWKTSENAVPLIEAGDSTEALNKLIGIAADGDEIIFDKGTYRLGGQLKLENRKGLKLIGYDAVIMSDYDKCHPNDCKTPFEFVNCDDIEIRGFTFTTSSPTNIWGRIIAWDKEEGWFDVTLPDDTYLAGNEWIEGLDTCNEDFALNFHIGWADYGKPHRWYKISRNTVRFLVWPSLRPSLDELHYGEIICMRYSLYAPGNFCCISCNRFLFEDITIEACPGISCTVHPRSSDFTFRRYNIKLPVNSKQAIACNTDGIHFIGMSGKLLLEDCHFEYMGDDSLNIHAQCGNIYGVEGNVITSGILRTGDSINEPPAESLSPNYAQKGDILFIYDGKTKIKRGEMIVEAYEVNKFTVSDIKGEYALGDIIVNSAYYPETIVKNCSVSRSRARGMLFQTNNVTVDGCYFEKTAGTGVVTLVGIGGWNEMGPAHNMTVRNCVFNGCRTEHSQNKADGITIGRPAWGYKCDNVGVFGNITIENNKFFNMGGSAIFAGGVDGLNISGNEIINCNKENELRPDMYQYGIVIDNCENVNVNNNTSDKDKIVFNGKSN